MPVKKVTFEWDEEKDNENQEKHGVPFASAQQDLWSGVLEKREDHL